MDYLRSSLANGLRVIQVPMAQMQSASAVIYIGVGSRYEDAGEAGVSHMVEHMLFKGTSRRPKARHISEAIETVGGVLNASTDKELTVYWSKTAKEHLPLALDLLADMIVNSRLGQADLAREQKVVAEELAMLADDPQDWVHVLADEILWPRQPLGREIAGTRDSVLALQQRDIRRFMSRYYGPNNAVLSVAGGVDPDETLREIEERFGTWTPVPGGEAPPASIPQAGPRSRVERKPIEQVSFCLVYPGMPRRHPDRWALDVLLTMLGSGTSCRLFLKLRERLGLVYDVQTYSSHYVDTGSITISCALEAANVDRALDAVFHEVERIQRRGVPGSELQKAKQFFRGRLSLGLEDTHAVAGWFGAQEMLHHRVITPEAAAAAVDAITGRDVVRVAREYLRPEEARLAAVGPITSLGVQEKLAGA